MIFKTLDHTGLETLCSTFNEAFSDYFVPLSLTPEQLKQKMKADGTDLSLSMGAFDQNRLVGFMLHGRKSVDGSLWAYNGGTGVIPSYRGQCLSKRMYAAGLPVFRERGVERVLLEVIDKNRPAIRSYQAAGFSKQRVLSCFKGRFPAVQKSSSADLKTGFAELKAGSVELRELETYDWQKMKSFWDCLPSWQHAPEAMEALRDKLVSVGAFRQGELIAYCLFNPENMRLQQLAVDRQFRRKGIALALLMAALEKTEKKTEKLTGAQVGSNVLGSLSMINVDQGCDSLKSFLLNLGLEHYLDQFEMELLL